MHAGIKLRSDLESVRKKCIQNWVLIFVEKKLSTIVVSIKGTVWAENIFFIICFYAIVHRRTIVQNKIISIICSCYFSVRLILIDLT